MKKTVVYPVVVLIVAAFSICGCNKSQNLRPPTSGNQTGSSGGSGGVPTTPTVEDTATSPLPIADIITTGTWRVTSYVEGVENSSSKFSSFTFTFLSDGTLVANEKGKITNGRWKNNPAIFYYGIPIYGSNPDGFNISIGTTRPLILLSKNLFISKKTLSNFYLDSVNPAEDSHITFSKI